MTKIIFNLVPRAFPLKNGWALFKGKALGTRLKSVFSLPAACRLFSRGVIFTRARVSLALLSLRTNGGLFVV